MQAALYDQKMLAAQSPIVTSPLNRPTKPTESGRRPLQPINIPSSPNSSTKDAISSSKSDIAIPISVMALGNQVNKENLPAFGRQDIPPPSNPKSETETNNELVLVTDASLAEELNAVRERLERLRLDREATETRLREKDRILQGQMEQLMLRGDFQKEFEMEVDRLYRLKQLQVKCMRMSPIRSLRERELGKKNGETQAEAAQSSRWETKVELSNKKTAAAVIGTRPPSLIPQNSRVIAN